YLNTVDGEIAFFRATMRARPVGIHRHFHILSIRSGIYKDTGVVVSVDDLWEKLRSCWNLDALELLVSILDPISRACANGLDQETDGYESPGSSSSTPMAITSPAEGDNVFSHPFFRAEYALPQDEALESMIAIRRARATASPVSPTPPPTKAKRMKTKTRTKRGKSKADMAGLVGGDSDSSALTQESGDEGVSPTPRSTVTGTEAGSEDGADEDVEMAEASPGAY
ncbi:hypothetical protein PLICRDRAFT_82332, partial [Plicaturopsis crispa FD-325 SS-3]